MSESPLPDSTRSGDNVYQVISNSRRRRLIWCLAMSDDGSMMVREIAAHIAAVEAGEVASEDIDRQSVTEMVHKLQDYHLDPLAELNIIKQGRDTVTTGPLFDSVLPMLVGGERFEST